MLATLRKAILAILALTALLSIAAFVRAFWKSDQIILDIVDDSVRCWRYGLLSDRGRVGLVVDYFEIDPNFVAANAAKYPPNGRKVHVVHIALDPPGNLDFWDALLISGGRSDSEQNHVRYEMSTLYFPVWLVCLVCALPLTVAAVRWRRRRILRQLGKCKRCGYDLRGTPDFCPECGPRRTKRLEPLDSIPKYNPMAGATVFLTEREAESTRRRAELRENVDADR